jgi:tetratricopeptide (TPR) repeat protein
MLLQTGARLGRYEIRSLLGEGGMGEVYRARDTRLGRSVAIKVLAKSLSGDARYHERLEREARTLSQLQHPHICTLYDFGSAGNFLYLVMEHLEGETLAGRLRKGPLPWREVVRIGREIAEAIEAAHRKGIVHRDLKPGNVMLSPSGTKVFDFGLAKGVQAQASEQDMSGTTLTQALTREGTMIGTLPYMAPEQVEGKAPDPRTDIWALGCVLYEMATGERPFRGESRASLIASIMGSEPKPVLTRQPGAPLRLDKLVRRCLEKDPERRWQSARDLAIEIGSLLEQSGSTPRILSAQQYLVSEVKRHRLGVLIALAALLTAAAGTFFYFNQKPALTDKDTILLAAFENTTGEEIFDGTLKQGLAVQLRQSPFLRLFPEMQVRQVLELMNLPPDERVTGEIAREICIRQNLKAFIVGSIAPLGSHYVITLEASNGQNGETLAQEQAEADSREQVLQTLSQVATRLREKLGESLSSIQRFDKPLVVVTTPNLEALKAWSLGLEQSFRGRPMEAIPFYKRAVELDPDFALAYSVLSATHWVTGRPRLAAEYAARGYALRDRVTEYEKLRITNFYHAFATGDLHKRIEVLVLLKRTYSRDAAGPTDLGATYNMIGQFEQALAEGREAVRRDPSFGHAHWILVVALVRLGRFAEAREAIAQAIQQKVDTEVSHVLLYEMAFISGDLAEMRRQIARASGKPDEYAALDWQTRAVAFTGRWRKAEELSRDAIDLAARGDTKEVAALFATEQALRAAALGDSAKAKAEAIKGLELERGRASLPRAALALAVCGETDQVTSLVDELMQRYPEDTVTGSIWLPMIRAALELQLGNASQAIALLQPTRRYEAAAEFWPQYLRGQAYLRLGKGMEASAEFQKILGSRGQAPLSTLYPLAHLGLARAQALRGDIDKSRQAYQDFLALWKNADPDLAILEASKHEFRGLRKHNPAGLRSSPRKRASSPLPHRRSQVLTELDQGAHLARAVELAARPVRLFGAALP